MKDSYSIKGGRPLKGEVVLSGAKNVALKAIIASLMFEGDVVLENVPRINDVDDLIELVKSIGGKAEFTDKNRLVVNGNNLSTDKVDLFHGSKIRVSLMLFAPLLLKYKKCFVPNPGGCRIGARPIDRIVDGMRAVGVKVDYDSETGYYQAALERAPSGSYRFSKPSHTGTELLILISLMTGDEVKLENCALEPEIDDLILFLNGSGAKIQKNKDMITIAKSLPLRQVKPFSIASDRNEFVTYATLAVASKGDVVVGSINESSVAYFLDEMKRMGAGIEKLPQGKFRFYHKGEIMPVNIETSPHPGFMTDWQPSFAILLLCADGVSTIRERVFENRFSYVNELKKLGAKIDFIEEEVKNPKEFYYFNYDENKKYQQAISIHGGQKLHNAVLDINDLRAGAALACAALLVEGESIVNGVSQLERGYEDFIGKIKKIGGQIKKL